MSIKLKSIVAGITMMLAFSTASAQVVEIDGIGADRDSALRDAERNAVSQVVGTLIDSRTVVKNGLVELDEIKSGATGFIRKSSILKEGSQGGSYHVLASVDVDTAPNTDLISRLTALMRLNDPKIAVAIVRDGQHDNYVELELNQRLIDMGFSHVVAPGVAEKINTDIDAIRIGGMLGIDYAVIGQESRTSKNIVIPDFSGGNLDTKIVKSSVDLSVRIIKLATGEVIETFQVKKNGIQLDNQAAVDKALGELAKESAEKLEGKFKKIGAKVLMLQ